MNMTLTEATAFLVQEGVTIVAIPTRQGYSEYTVAFFHPSRPDAKPNHFVGDGYEGNIEDAIISYAEVLKGTYVE